MKLPPAYRITYDVQSFSSTGLRNDSRMRGTVTGDWYELVGLEREESLEVFARLSVISWQPYEDDALPEALRTARDLCNVLSVAYGNQLAFEPVTPPEVEPLEGAKGQLPKGGGVSLTGTGHGIHIASAERYPLDAAGEIHGDPDLRADLDTWRLAMLESDGPTRLLHYFRIFEREADSLMDAEPTLLEDNEVAASAAAVMVQLPERLSGTERERIEQAVKSAVRRVRVRSRNEILAEALSQALGREVTAGDVGRVTSMRGRYAHRGTEMDTEPTVQDDELIRETARALLRRAIDRHLPSPG
jgi:hypothetical protein